MQDKLVDIAYRVRRNIVDLSEQGGCFIGAAYSCVEIVVYLYERILKFNFENPKDFKRDFFFLSKGHAVPTLYGYFAEKGLLASNRLVNHQSVKDDIYLHPNPNIPGIEFHSGSLGHLLSVAVGAALHFKRKNLTNKVFIILGDGELNEGSNWEALLIASAHHLDNIIIIIDRNGFQANFRTEELLPLEPLKDKFLSFGCIVFTVEGHNFNSLENCFQQLKDYSGRPIIIIANTVRGKGLSIFENDWDKWFVKVNNEEKASLINQIQIVKD